MSITHPIEKFESVLDFPLPSQCSNQVVEHNHLRVYALALHLLKQLQGFFFVSLLAQFLNAVTIPDLLPLDSAPNHRRKREKKMRNIDCGHLGISAGMTVKQACSVWNCTLKHYSFPSGGIVGHRSHFPTATGWQQHSDNEEHNKNWNNIIKTNEVKYLDQWYCLNSRNPWGESEGARAWLSGSLKAYRNFAWKLY